MVKTPSEKKAKSNNNERASHAAAHARAKSIRPVTGPLRYVYISLGILCIILGAIGVPLPLVPTAPFLLLAAYFFLRSSHTMYDWLVSHKTLGPFIVDYIEYGVVPLRAKVIASVMITTGISISILFLMPPILLARVLLIVIGLSVIIFLMRKPSNREEAASSQ